MLTQVAGCVLEVWVITSRRGWMRCIHSAPLRALPACAAPFCAWHQEALEKTPWVAAQLEDRMAKREDLVGWLATVSPQEALAAAAPYSSGCESRRHYMLRNVAALPMAIAFPRSLRCLCSGLSRGATRL